MCLADSGSGLDLDLTFYLLQSSRWRTILTVKTSLSAPHSTDVKKPFGMSFKNGKTAVDLEVNVLAT